ncbi:DUF167 domain-containing protein [Aspergillus stella-maris]|uniref:DUF167 domain-containing protein n=1 Tax=Aspergillus stella-maris TaxID=1810926 RepID=UPI003CCDCE1D
MPPPPHLRLIQTAAATTKHKFPGPPARFNLQIACRVKPNASKNQEGITAIGTGQVSVAVAAVPRDGEANVAVARVFAKVFNVPKSDVGVIHGLKSRDKTVCISDLKLGKESEEEFLSKAGQQLQDAVVKK